jgi:plastocyanin
VAFGIMVLASIVVSRRHVGGSAMFALFGGILGITMLVGGVALLAGQPEEEVEIPVVQLAAPPNASVDGYDLDTLTVPAQVEFEIEFDNQEEGVQHNVDIADGDPAAGGATIAETTIITGPAVSTYRYEPLEVGEYVFFCIVHPTTMKGTLVVAEGAEPGGGGGGGGNGGGVVVVAKDIAFDTDTIDLPADTESQIDFDNQDPGVPHNIAIYTDDTLTESLFVGEIVNGVAQVVYDVPALAEGEYYFRCDVHPTMEGTVVVSAAGGGGEGEGGGAEPPPDEGGGGSTGEASISAKANLFDLSELTLPADVDSTLAFDNQDPGIPHNVSIYSDDTASDALFVGEIINGPDTIDYAIPPLAAGEYYFRCDVHPTTMEGTLTVT